MRRPAPDLPAPGQESVWAYPRPPACIASERHVVVRAGGRLVADSRAAYRVLETSHPPTWYVPRADVLDGALAASGVRSTWCEWKGAATYWDVFGVEAAGWSYEHPSPGFVAITGHLAFSPRQLQCEVDGVAVRPQPGDFYAGWITPDVAGPFKGIPGSMGW
jgi:uncharacterized protein (DUF427 family)